MRPGTLVLIAALLAGGCLSADTGSGPDQVGGPAEADTATQRAAALTFSTCDHQEGFFGVPIDEVRALLPPGFEPTPMAAAAGQPVLAGFYISAFQCDAAQRDEGPPIEGPRILWAGVAVVPPPGLRAGDKDFTGLLLGSYHSDPATASVFDAWMQGTVRTGAVELTYLGPGVPGVGVAEAASGPAGLRLTTAVGQELEPMDVLAARFFAVDGDGTVLGAMDLDAIEHEFYRGAATFELQGDGLFGHEAPTPVQPVGWQGPLAALAFSWVDVDTLRAEPQG